MFSNIFLCFFSAFGVNGIRVLFYRGLLVHSSIIGYKLLTVGGFLEVSFLIVKKYLHIRHNINKGGVYYSP